MMSRLKADEFYKVLNLFTHILIGASMIAWYCMKNMQEQKFVMCGMLQGNDEIGRKEENLVIYSKKTRR